MFELNSQNDRIDESVAEPGAATASCSTPIPMP